MPHSNDEYPMSRKPLIGVSACTKQIGHHSFHIAGDKYLRAAAIAGVPLVIPALDELIDPATLLESFDGLLFTGSARAGTALRRGISAMKRQGPAPLTQRRALCQPGKLRAGPLPPAAAAAG